MARKLSFMESDKPKYAVYGILIISTIILFSMEFIPSSLSIYDINTGQILNNDGSRADGITHKKCFGGGYVTESTSGGITTTHGNCGVISSIFNQNSIILFLFFAIIIISIIVLKRRQN